MRSGSAQRIPICKAKPEGSPDCRPHSRAQGRKGKRSTNARNRTGTHNPIRKAHQHGHPGAAGAHRHENVEPHFHPYDERAYGHLADVDRHGSADSQRTDVSNQ